MCTLYARDSAHEFACKNPCVCFDRERFAKSMETSTLNWEEKGTLIRNVNFFENFSRVAFNTARSRILTRACDKNGTS